jgi:hypothetical protein
VRGSAWGFVLVRARGTAGTGAVELRWVFGSFDETFRVQRTPELTIRALGLGGSARLSVRFLPGPDLGAKQIARRARLCWSAPRIPRLRPLSTQAIHALAKDQDR